MDFSNHPLNKQSTIDNRRLNIFNQSIIDSTHYKLSTLLQDDNLGKGLVALALKHLTESEIYNLADYAKRKGDHPGKAFVGLCKKAVREKSA